LKKSTILIALLALLAGCGTLGGFDPRTFSTKKIYIEHAIDSLYSVYPDYRMPAKWKKYDFWGAAGYGFLETRMFYFKNPPEEMYYVSFIDYPSQDTTTTTISIRSVFNGERWSKEEDTHRQEEDRIEKRFDSEIVSKLGRFSNSYVITDN
jgi:hypothetical protein